MSVRSREHRSLAPIHASHNRRQTRRDAAVAGRDERLTKCHFKKAPRAIKVLDAAMQDDVAMRNILWRGTTFYERKLSTKRLRLEAGSGFAGNQLRS
jgi:hypothetical protein